MTIINMTPHAVNLEVPGNVITFPPSGKTIRIDQESYLVGSMAIGNYTIPVYRTEYGNAKVVDADGNCTELPDVEEGTYYIVSAITAQQVKRNDFLITNEAVRDDNGRIIGCRSFAMV